MTTYKSRVQLAHAYQWKGKTREEAETFCGEYLWLVASQWKFTPAGNSFPFPQLQIHKALFHEVFQTVYPDDYVEIENRPPIYHIHTPEYWEERYYIWE